MRQILHPQFTISVQTWVCEPTGKTDSKMSGGGNKKKAQRGQGWEEAGAEFYQESYPTDAELDVLQRDPKHLATLLPSKQTRGNTRKIYDL